MRKPSASAFTLVEMLTVLAIIVILTSLVVAVGGYVQKKSALQRAAGEISMLVSACESYKGDNGNYPRDIPSNTSSTSTTDLISPKVDFVPTNPKYAASSLFLYKELSGDKTGGIGDKPDGIPDDGQPVYLKDVQPSLLKVTKKAGSNAIASVDYIKDPFGFPYAYSTSAARDEQTYQATILKNPVLRNTLQRPTGSALHGFNAGSFDLWSTGGDTKGKGPDVWIKNW
jgi:prepilin-type N-terminal cleavage/methylation domain-containing protein